MAEPSEFQARLMDAITNGKHNAMSLSELAFLLKSNRAAVHSAARSLERNGWAVIFRSDQSQWGVLLVAPSNAWRTRGVLASEGETSPRETPMGEDRHG